MAISYVDGLISAGAANPTTGCQWYVSTTNLAGLQTGDLVLGMIYSYAPTKSFTTAPNATYWTNLIDYNTNNGHMWVYYAFYTSSLDTYDTFDFASVTNGTTYYWVAAFTGVNSSTPIDNSYSTAYGSSSTTFDPPSHTVNTSGSCVIAICGNTQEATSNDPTNLSNNYSTNYTTNADLCWTSTSGSDACAMMEYRLNVSSGSENPGTCGNIVSAGWQAHTFALRPASGTTLYWFPQNPLGSGGVYGI